MCTQLFDPKVDYIFKNIFGSEKHPKILISFLNACIKPESPITAVKIKNTEITKEYIEESFSRLDVLATTQEGEIINIEMPRTICINVLDFKLLEEENFHNTYVLKNKENNNLITDTLELHFVEIPKMKEINQNDMLSLWTAFLDDPNNDKLVALESKYEELHEAKIELARLSRDPEEAEKYRMRENAMNERRNFFLETLDKGLEEGKKVGEMNAKIKIAIKLRESFDINTISDMTDLKISELEEIFNNNI